MLLWIQVGLNKDVDFTLSCPVPVLKNVLAKVCDIGKVDLVVWLLQPWPLVWTWMFMWIIVWLLRWWE